MITAMKITKLFICLTLAFILVYTCLACTSSPSEESTPDPEPEIAPDDQDDPAIVRLRERLSPMVSPLRPAGDDAPPVREAG